LTATDGGAKRLSRRGVSFAFRTALFFFSVLAMFLSV
jgi:hypothetical protein